MTAQVPRRRTRDVRLDDHDWLRARYVDDGLNVSAIGRIVGAADGTVLAALDRAGIERRTKGGGNPIRYAELRDPDFMTEHFVRRCGFKLELARRFGCAEKTVREATLREPVATAMHEAGFDQDAAIADMYLGPADHLLDDTMPTWGELRRFAQAATAFCVRDVATHFNLRPRQTSAVWDALDELVGDGDLQHDGARWRYRTTATAAHAA